MLRFGILSGLLLFMICAVGCGGGTKETANSGQPKESSPPSQATPAKPVPPAKEEAPAAPAARVALPKVDRVVMASGMLQKCLGIQPGAARMMRGPQTQQFCDQLPGADFYNQAGQRFQAGDHAGAAQVVRKAAEAGNAVAQLRLALMYDQGDGLPKSARDAYTWYARAAALGEPESLNQMGGYYELSQDEDWDLAAQLWQASAEQGWMKGQFSFGRAYQFGIGVAQNRQEAIAWYRRAAAQGHPDGKHWAQWLSDPTNNVGFRDDAEHDFVMGPYLRYGVGSLMGGDPAGIAFHNSAQRAMWIKGYSQRIAKDEQEIMRSMHQAELNACRSAGGDCTFLRF